VLRAAAAPIRRKRKRAGTSATASRSDARRSRTAEALPADDPLVGAPNLRLGCIVARRVGVSVEQLER
jgi:hypothetical protein